MWVLTSRVCEEAQETERVRLGRHSGSRRERTRAVLDVALSMTSALHAGGKTGLPNYLQA